MAEQSRGTTVKTALPKPRSSCAGHVVPCASRIAAKERARRRRHGLKLMQGKKVQAITAKRSERLLYHALMF